MNCSEVKEGLPLYLSGEAEGESLEHHLADCQECRRLVMGQRADDQRLRAVVLAENPDPTGILQNVRSRISSVAQPKTEWVKWGAVAAVLVAVLAGYGWHLGARPSRIYTDAARDHRTEVMEHRARRWRTGPELVALTKRYALSESAIEQLAPAGYHLQHAKTCGLAGQYVLHLVYTNGVDEVSLYLRQQQGSPSLENLRKVANEKLIRFHTARYEGIVVGSGSEAECMQFSEVAAHRLEAS